MRRIVAICVLLAALLAPAGAAAQGGENALRRTLTSAIRGAGSGAGAFAIDATNRRILFEYRATRSRVLASNAKLFTTAATLAKFGPQATIETKLLGDGQLDPFGSYSGSLYLRGEGDPAFGSRSFTRRAYGSGAATVEDLADKIQATGIRSVQGRVVGDEGDWDARRGGPESAFGVSPYVGPLSALAFNRGLANEGGSAFQASPPGFAAARLDAELERRGIRVRLAPRAGATPPGAEQVAGVVSLPMARIAAITNKPSDNFFAEMLLKHLGDTDATQGSTAAGAREAAAFARRLGARVRLADGSGLSRADRASPRAVAELLDEMRSRPEFDAFYQSLAVAGRDGTLRTRMRGGRARGNCRGKTGTLIGVSTLSGYCSAQDGDVIVFSFLMNGVSPAGARSIQDRMAQALAGYGG